MPEITQNKLLKVIEEPPTGALFIFTVLSADALLPTIRSRAQILPCTRRRKAKRRLTCRTRPACPWRKLKSLHLCTAATSAECFRTAKTAAPQKRSKWRKTLQTHSFPARSMTFGGDRAAHQDKPLFPESMERLQLLLRDACLLKNNVNVQVPAREVCDKLRRKLSLKR